jgi:hypothetical protein
MCLAVAIAIRNRETKGGKAIPDPQFSQIGPEDVRLDGTSGESIDGDIENGWHKGYTRNLGPPGDKALPALLDQADFSIGRRRVLWR